MGLEAGRLWAALLRLWVMELNLTSSAQIRSILTQHGLRPKKRLGQNFLIDRNILNRIVDAADAGPGENVLEVGPGLGVMTKEIAERGARVVCVEADKDFLPILEDVLADKPNVEIVIQDFLKVDLPEFLGSRADGKWVMIGNLPYYITSPIIAKLLESKQLISRILLMVQREVALRLQAKPDTDDYGSLSVFVQYHCDVTSVIKVSKNVFYPVPDVDSEFIKLTVRDEPSVKVCNEQLFFNIVRASFGKRRKTLLNALSSSADLLWDKDRADLVLKAAGIDGVRRGETLSLQEFADLTNAACGERNES